MTTYFPVINPNPPNLRLGSPKNRLSLSPSRLNRPIFTNQSTRSRIALSAPSSFNHSQLTAYQLSAW
jgi:hypothetical protein